jgi:hypothetical protein
MDHRKVCVKSLESFNEYFEALGFKGYKLSVKREDPTRIHFVGRGRFGNANSWDQNSFPKTLLKKITYADWVDVFFLVSDTDWDFKS